MSLAVFSRSIAVAAAFACGVVGCGGDENGPDPAVEPDASVSDAGVPGDASSDAGGSDGGPPATTIRVMTMNIGTTPTLGHDSDDNGYTQEMADITDELYNNSLSWNPAEAALTEFIAAQQPDIVAFQEGFWDPWCEEIVVDPTLDFVCRDYTAERLLQVIRVTGPEFHAACGDGQEDNCVAVRRSVGTIVGCDADVCAGGLEGDGPPSGCSNGARVGRIAVRLADGSEVVVVNVHGTSGFSDEDQACRVDQFAQIFEDRGDGVPAANGARNIVLGDVNTDPVVLRDSDPSADYLMDQVEQSDYRFHSPNELGAPATYLVLRIDHVLSDFAEGDCSVHGSSPGTEPVLDSIYFDHRPVVCDLTF